MGSLIDLDANIFMSTIHTNIPVLIDFWAEWCTPCKAMLPVLDKLQAEYAGKVVFAKINVDNHYDITQKYAITSIPTIILFKNGQVVKRLTGLHSDNTIREALSSLF